MAAITKVDPKLASPVGYENVFYAYASEPLEAGDVVVITSATAPGGYDCVVEEAAAAVGHGIVLKDVGTRGTAEVCWRGEMDGFAGLTPGAPLTIASGVIDDTAPAEGVSTNIRAVTPTRIRFDLI